jgi:glutamine transport system ATP-binding protein
VIRIQGLHKAFGAASVLSGVDGEIAEGGIVAVLGASGCGKSTLLRCLNGLESFDAGSIRVGEFELAPGGASPHALTSLRSTVGMVFQEFHLFPHLSVLDNVTLAPRVVKKLSRPEAEAQAMSLLELVGLASRAKARPAELSGGQKQRVAIARAIAQGARVLLFDEPTSALDPDLREEVREVLRKVARGELHALGSEQRLTLVLVTHELRLARELATELWVMAAGKIAERGAPRELMAAPETAAARELFGRAE